MMFDKYIRSEVGSAEAWIWLIQSASYQGHGSMKKAKSMLWPLMKIVIFIRGHIYFARCPPLSKRPLLDCVIINVVGLRRWAVMTALL